MYLKTMTISAGNKIIRTISFKYGLNIIVDDTPLEKETTYSGNNVGKTTVLKLVYFCFGGKPELVYRDVDASKQVLTAVRDFLVDYNVLITLVLAENLENDDCKKVIIERSFGKPKVLKVNGSQTKVGDFEDIIKKSLFPDLIDNKPSLKELVSRNIRFKEESISNTLMYLGKFASLEEYEALFLYMFGCKFDNASSVKALSEEITKESTFKRQLEGDMSLSKYKAKLAYTEQMISKLEKEKHHLKINLDYENNLNELVDVRQSIGHFSSKRTSFRIKKELIESSVQKLESEVSLIDVDEMQRFYSEIKLLNPNIQVEFEEMLDFHNKMIDSKKRFLLKDYPSICDILKQTEIELAELIKREQELQNLLNESSSSEHLKEIELQLYLFYEDKGRCSEMIERIEAQERVIESKKKEQKSLTQDLYSEENRKRIEKRINDFNMFFSSVSDRLYGEKYLISVEIQKNKKTGKDYYKFSTFNDNIGSGKKQGEILSFDLAYLEFAKKYNIPTLSFIMNDKKELMHNNQLIIAADYSEKEKAQLILPFLRDKLPTSLNDEKYFSLVLSQTDKLFRIESFLKEQDNHK